MNTLEMLQALTENPNRKAVMLVDEDGDNVEHFDEKLRTAEVGIFGVLKWADNGENLIIYATDKRVWKIIEPPKKLKQMCFGEAYWYFINSAEVTCSDITNVKTGLGMDTPLANILKEEFMGLWTVKGIYEEEE